MATKRLSPFQKAVHPHVGKAALIGGVALAVTAVVAVINSNSPFFKPTTAPTVTPSVSRMASKTFTSPDLGISFDYAVGWGPGQGGTYVAKEIRNRVYIYQDGLQPESGLWVEVYAKNASDSITDTIKKQFLHEVSSNDCQVQTIDNPAASKNWKQQMPQSYSFAEVVVPNFWTLDRSVVREHLSQCPTGYTVSGQEGLTYFLVDANHPTKLLFFKIGTSNLSAGKPDVRISWNDTIHFFP